MQEEFEDSKSGNQNPYMQTHLTLHYCTYIIKDKPR